jgi:hypothetical protein
VLPTVGFSPATTVEFTAAANRRRTPRSGCAIAGIKGVVEDAVRPKQLLDPLRNAERHPCRVSAEERWHSGWRRRPKSLEA